MTENDQKWVEKYKQERPQKAEKIWKILKYYDKSKSNPIILDLGCFEGKMEEQFRKFTNNAIIGIEISFSALKNAISNMKNLDVKNVDFIVADAKHLPIKDDSIDWIICNQVIDCLENKIETVQEFDRALKSDGFIYLSTASNLFLKLYRKFPKLFTPHVGPYYGRFMTELDSEFITPMNYKFWKKAVLENTKLSITDATPLVASNKIKTQSSKNSENKFISFFYYFFRNWSPTWIFILQHNLLKRKNR